MTGIPTFDDVERDLRETHGAPNREIFTVSGLTGAGTTTHAKFLCDVFGFDRVTAGDFFRERAAEMSMSIQEFDRRQPTLEDELDTDFDMEWDRTALEYAFTRNRFVLEGRLAGALLQDIAPLRIWVTCDPDTVADRIRGREDMTKETAREHVRSRNRDAMNRYKEKYDIDPRDSRFYNVKIDNTGDLDDVQSTLLSKVKAVLQSEHPGLLNDLDA